MSSYRDAIEVAVEKEKDILGEDTALKIAKEVDELQVDEEGNVLGIDDDGKTVLNQLVTAYQNVGGSISATLIARALKQHDITDLDMPSKLEGRV